MPKACTCTEVLLNGIPSIPRGRLDGMGPYEPSSLHPICTCWHACWLVRSASTRPSGNIVIFNRLHNLLSCWTLLSMPKQGAEIRRAPITDPKGTPSRILLEWLVRDPASEDLQHCTPVQESAVSAWGANLSEHGSLCQTWQERLHPLHEGIRNFLLLPLVLWGAQGLPNSSCSVCSACYTALPRNKTLIGIDDLLNFTAGNPQRQEALIGNYAT